MTIINLKFRLKELMETLSIAQKIILKNRVKGLGARSLEALR
jgi:hypothetical protein